MRESFVFYQSFYEALKELPDDVRLKLYDMISVYALTGEEPDCNGIEKAVFSLIKPQIKANNQRYKNGCNAAEFGVRGGRPRKPQENPEETPNKPQENPKKTPNENVNENVNDIPPLFIPPPNGGEKEKTAEDLFFEKYPRYAKDRAKARKDFDYNRLLEEFERSSYCRSLYTLKQVNDNYALIVAGDFRDKPKQEDKLSDINAKAERERWYSTRKAKAETKAEQIHERFMQDEEFKAIERRLNVIPIDQAKADVKASQGDKKALMELAKLEREKNRLVMQRRNIIERNGLTEEDLLPQYVCKKCSDTGYLPDGRLCDCYDKEKE